MAYNYPTAKEFCRFTSVRLLSGHPAPILREHLKHLSELDAEEYFSKHLELYRKQEIFQYNYEESLATLEVGTAEVIIELEDGEIPY